MNACLVQEPKLDAVLLIPPKLTEKTYAALLRCNCVLRPWELHGRTGSRVHRHNETNVGIPIISKELVLEKSASNEELHDIISSPGVTIITKEYTPARTAHIYDDKKYDARIHPERAPSTNNNMPVPSKRMKTIGDTSNLPAAFTYAELFAGIGGFGVALEKLGGECVFCSELEPCCRNVYSQNFPNTKLLKGDIYEVLDSELPRTLDLLVGGFPCQPFSTLGEQPGLTCPKGNLFLQIVRVLNVSKPKAFLLENVQGLLGMKKDLDIILNALASAGYEVATEVCNARGLTTSTRKRLFFVGLRKDDGQTVLPFMFPYIPDLGLRARDVLNYDDNPENHGLRVNDEQFDRLRREKYWRPPHLAWPNTVCSTLVSHYGNAIAQGNSQLVPCLRGNPRRFTPRECARIMGFPETFILPKQKENQSYMAHVKEQYRMLGNAVCPPVIAALAGAILALCPDIAGYDYHGDWIEWGRTCAVDIAMSAALSKFIDSSSKRDQL
jgi:DNA (cytosine-5)-methyltransferase 1